jgi:TolA-binding protein
MENNYKHISQNEFKKYLAGKMTAQEKAAFEQWVENDPFAKEALEGFLLLENNTKAIELIESESKLLTEKTGYVSKNGAKGIPLFRVIGIAASLILVVGGVVFSYQLLQNNNQLAEASSETHLEFKTPKKERKLKKDAYHSNDSIYELFEEEQELAIPIQTQKKIDLPEIKEENILEKSVANIIADNEDSKPAAPLFSNTFKEEDSVSESAGSSSFESRSAAKTTVVAESIVQQDANISTLSYNKGYEKFQEGNFDQAISFFNESISNQEKVTESNYYIGMSLYYQKKYNKAIKSYDTVIKTGSGGLVNNAKWYKANALIELGKKSDAKVILENLIENNSTFKTQAIEILKSL